MKSSSIIFIFLSIGSFIIDARFLTDKCAGRWQIRDNMKIKVIFNWQISPATNLLAIEFRTHLVQNGYWYGFSISPPIDQFSRLVYALQWKDNDTDISWDIYNVTNTSVTVLRENRTSSIAFQRLPSSGLLTVHTTLNSSSLMSEKHCMSYVYMRGRFQAEIPRIPDEIRFNQSLCLTCEQTRWTSMETSSIAQDTSTASMTTMNELTSQSMDDVTSFHKDVSKVTSPEAVLSYSRNEYQFIWFGRILNRSWTNDYLNLSSFASQNLRLDLQNLFLFLINHNSSSAFICNQFDFYSLKSGSILFASNITLISNLSKNQTLTTVDQLIRSVNHSEEYNLNFDQTAHQLIADEEASSVNRFFGNLSRTVAVHDDVKQAQLDLTFHLLVGGIFGFACFMVIVTSILCLYGYYKCRRRQFRLFAQRQTLKFKHDLDSYKWLGKEPSLGSSSPYLIQSTSI